MTLPHHGRVGPVGTHRQDRIEGQELQGTSRTWQGHIPVALLFFKRIDSVDEFGNSMRDSLD